MTMSRETALKALDLKAKTVLEALTPPVIYLARNADIAESLGDAGEVTVSGNAKVLAALKDGEAAQPVANLGEPPIYDHVQTPVLEFAVIHPDADKRDTALDLAFAAIDTMLKNDPTLGGACDLAMPHPPDVSNIGGEGVPDGKAAELPIDLIFSSDSPIG